MEGGWAQNYLDWVQLLGLPLSCAGLWGWLPGIHLMSGNCSTPITAFQNPCLWLALPERHAAKSLGKLFYFLKPQRDLLTLVVIVWESDAKTVVTYCHHLADICQRCQIGRWITPGICQAVLSNYQPRRSDSPRIQSQWSVFSHYIQLSILYNFLSDWKIFYHFS